MRNLDTNTISVKDVLHTLRECNRDSKYEGAFEHMLAFASELTGLSEDFLLEHMDVRDERPKIDFSRVSFRDYDDTEVPLQVFFGYRASPAEQEELVGSVGYRREDCRDFELVLNVYNEDHCPLEAVLTLVHGDQRWEDVAEFSDQLDAFLDTIRNSDSERAREVMGRLKELLGDYVNDEKTNGERQINREKLADYLAEEMIMEFESAEECRVYFNTYDGQDFETVADMKQYQGEYGFGLDGKWYHINFDEALDVWEPVSLEKQIAKVESCKQHVENKQTKSMGDELKR